MAGVCRWLCPRSCFFSCPSQIIVSLPICCLTIDPEKSELLHFTRAKNPEELPNVTARDHGLTVYASDQPVRWLGVWFDAKLRFTEHVKKRAAQARVVVQHLRSLANTQRGPPLRALRKIIFTCVLPILTYGSKAWYEGRMKTRMHASRTLNMEIQTRQEAHMDEIDRVLREAIRVVLPVWKTTPTATLY